MTFRLPLIRLFPGDLTIFLYICELGPNSILFLHCIIMFSNIFGSIVVCCVVIGRSLLELNLLIVELCSLQFVTNEKKEKLTHPVYLPRFQMKRRLSGLPAIATKRRSLFHVLKLVKLPVYCVILVKI